MNSRVVHRTGDDLHWLIACSITADIPQTTASLKEHTMPTEYHRIVMSDSRLGFRSKNPKPPPEIVEEPSDGEREPSRGNHPITNHKNFHTPPISLKNLKLSSPAMLLKLANPNSQATLELG